MNRRVALCGLVGLVLLALAVAPASAMVMVLDEESCTYGGSWSYGSGGDVGKYCVRGDERYATDTSATATWTPGVSGAYDLQVHWYSWSTHSSSATYTVNHAGGSTPVTVGQNHTASQGNPGSLDGVVMGSGWYTLGSFDLTPSSTVVLSNVPGGGPLSADALRVSDEGIIIDEYSANATYVNAWYYPRAFASNDDDESSQYTHRYGGTDSAIYTPGITGATEVKLSWPVHSAHGTAASYAITDAAGVVHTVTIDERKYADQVTSPTTTTQPDWSGWYNAGSFNLGPASTVVQTNAGSGALGADALHVRQLSGYPAEVVKSSAVGYWRLGEANGATTAVNAGTAGQPLNGTYSPAKVSAPGLIASDPDTAADFNGSTTQVAGTGISTAAPGGTSVFAGDWTIEAWLERDTVADWQAVFSNNNGASNAPLMTFIAGYTGEPHNLGINGSGSTPNNVSVDLSQFGGPGDPTAYLGKPVYAVITKTGGDAAGTNTIAVYANVDGTWLSPATGSTTWNLNAGADGYYIGRHYSGATQILNGRIDEVAIYSKALTPGEVHSHYGSGSLAAPEGYMTAVMNDGPVGYWRLGEAAASTKALNYGSAGAALNGAYSPAKAAAPGLIVWSNDAATDFNGTSAHVAGSNVAATGVFDNEWTIEAWLSRDAVTQWSGVFSNNTTSPFRAPLMTFIDSTHRLGINGAGATANNISVDLAGFGGAADPEAYLGETVYAVITKTGGNAAGTNAITVYANVAGTWLTQATGSTSWDLNPADGFYIGRHYALASQILDGTIDEVAIYGYALTGEQVREHYYAAVPEPATLVLLAGGCLALVRRRRKR